MCQMSEKELCKMIGNSVPVPMVGEILQEAMFAAGFDRCQKKVSLASWFQLDWLHRSAWLLRPTLNKNQVTVTLDMGPHEKIEGTCVSPDWLKRFLFLFSCLDVTVGAADCEILAPASSSSSSLSGSLSIDAGALGSTH